MTRRIPFCLLAALAMAGIAAAQKPAPPATPVPSHGPEAAPARLTDEKTGRIATREGMRLRLTTDTGNIRITTQGTRPDEVSYRVRVETDPRQPEAQKLLKQFQVTGVSMANGVHINGSVPWAQFRGRLWITFDVSVPKNYNLEITTGAGNIETEDIEGRAALSTQGGNITAGRVSGSARLETQGGHITVRDVGADLVAATAGGHVSVGNVQGSGVLRTGGGHIKLDTIQGTSQLETGGGEITVQRAGVKVTAISGGGQITFVEAAGAIQARTGGGGVKVMRVVGPMQLDTGGGSVYLTSVQGPVRASTAGGNITAWFVSDAKKPGASQLACTQGDILVYLPRKLPMTIDATIEMAGEHSVDAEADPALLMKVNYVPTGSGTRTLRAEGTLNGGGEVLRLRTISGNIKLRFADSAGPREKGMEVLRLKQLEQRHEQQQKVLERQLERSAEAAQRDLQARARELERERSSYEVFKEKLNEIWERPKRVDAEAQQEKLKNKVLPVYPDFARRGRIEGKVQLEVLVAEDGSVADVKVLSGHPLLTAAARQAISRWQYEPTLVGGRPVKVITRVDVDFKLQ